jgi:hypothetical protein
MSSMNADIFTSFLICLSFIFSYCLIALAQYSSIILKRSCESGLPHLVFDSREKALCIFPWNIMLAVNVS